MKTRSEQIAEQNAEYTRRQREAARETADLQTRVKNGELTTAEALRIRMGMKENPTMTPITRARLRDEGDTMLVAHPGGTPAERAEFHAICAERTDTNRDRRAHTRAAGIACRDAKGDDRALAAKSARRAARACRQATDELEANGTDTHGLVVLMGREAAAEAEAAANTADAERMDECTKQ